MWNKYCKKLKPTEVLWKNGTQIWKKMIEARDQLDRYIWWEPRRGNADSWEDNWTRLGAIKVTNLDVVRDNIVEDLSFFHAT